MHLFALLLSFNSMLVFTLIRYPPFLSHVKYVFYHFQWTLTFNELLMSCVYNTYKDCSKSLMKTQPSFAQ